MKSRQFILFMILDLVILMNLLLLSTYYGMSHIFLLALGVIFLLLSVYDRRTGRLSVALMILFDLPSPPEKEWINWLPVFFSLALVLYCLPLLLEHGFVDWPQRWAMQGGLFRRFSLWAAAGTALAIIAAVWATVKPFRKR